jgi:hypothetical protein
MAEGKTPPMMQCTSYWLAKISVEGSVWGDLGSDLHSSEVGEVSAMSQGKSLWLAYYQEDN